ncbi:MAG TPA: ATP synthase F1 subunit gamma [Solirubrobacteraceae bacterium]|jgi:F-type H+-transporting ATPase subunit gamma|nr:ATP synthase F1 subunit gamma [Solirubrobacteraceae bacterium]
MASQRDVKNRISSVKNIQKITRAMEMVAAARLRRAEQRIEALRPYAEALRRMTRTAARAAGAAEIARLPLLREPAAADVEGGAVALLLITGDRGLAGGFNSQVIRAGVRRHGELAAEGHDVAWYVTGRRGVSSVTFRGFELSGGYTGFADRPVLADARTVGGDVIEAFTAGGLYRVELIFNAYVSPLTQVVTRETLLPISQATIAGDEEAEEGEAGAASDGPGALVEYEPDPEQVLRQLLPDYIETSIYRAMVESASGFFGAQMTAMRSASDNAGEIITDLTLQMNRARQAEITQEIMEVVAGAEGLA